MKKITKIDELTKSQLSKNKLRVAAYARVSTDSDDQLVSLKAQREHYETILNPIRNGSLPDFIMTKAYQAPRRKNDLNFSV